MSSDLELLIGFNARENFLKFEDAWDNTRIKKYLLKEDVIKPLSVDVMVWDTVFHALQVQLPDWIGPRQEWDSLEKLKAFIKKEKIEKSYCLIAISQWATDGNKNTLETQYDIKPISPAPEWRLLGFDIADTFLLTGIMNAGYETEEHEILRQEWSGFLNQYHLFDDLVSAFKFKSLTDERVREHSPFHVYGIYLVETITST